MGWGGKRRGAGRPKGGKNRNTIVREQLGRELAAKMKAILGVDAFPGDGVALMQLVYKNPDLPMELRLDAAKAAASFERPRLSSIDHQGEAARDCVARMPMKSANMDDWARQLDQEERKSLEEWAADLARGLPKPKLTNDPPDDDMTRQ